MTSLPPSLVRFRSELEQAIDGDRRRAPSRRRFAVRLSLAGLAFAGVALGVLSLVSSRAPSVVRPAAAESAVQRATAALAVAPGTVLHVDMVGTQRNGDGTTVSWEDESWQQASAPFDRRQIETAPDEGTVESAIAGGVDEVYDSSTNTIYVSAPTPKSTRPKYELTPGSAAGTFVLTVPAPRFFIKKATSTAGVKVVSGHPQTLTITAAQAQALRAGTAVVEWNLSKKAGGSMSMTPTVAAAPDSARAAAPPDPDSAAFRDQILALLRSGGASVAGHATIGGKDTIEIDAAGGGTVYYVDPATYAPVELDTHGDGGGTSLRFRVYEDLPAGTASSALLSLGDQHPSATVDRNPADFSAAEGRLFPHG